MRVVTVLQYFLSMHFWNKLLPHLILMSYVVHQEQCTAKRRVEKMVVKEKMARNAASRRKTGGGEAEEEEFDEVEELYAQAVSMLVRLFVFHLVR